MATLTATLIHPVQSGRAAVTAVTERHHLAAGYVERGRELANGDFVHLAMARAEWFALTNDGRRISGVAHDRAHNAATEVCQAFLQGVR